MWFKGWVEHGAVAVCGFSQLGGEGSLRAVMIVVSLRIYKISRLWLWSKRSMVLLANAR